MEGKFHGGVIVTILMHSDSFVKVFIDCINLFAFGRLYINDKYI